MKHCTRLLCGLAVLTLAVTGPILANQEVSDTTEVNEVTLEGSFVWAREDEDQTGDLTAVLTPDGENAWSVAFHFTWEEEPRVFLGTASGSLSDGPLEGTAENDDEDHKMEFRFSGDVENGTFTGTHGFVMEDGSLKDGGTLTLSAAD